MTYFNGATPHSIRHSNDHTLVTVLNVSRTSYGGEDLEAAPSPFLFGQDSSNPQADTPPAA